MTTPSDPEKLKALWKVTSRRKIAVWLTRFDDEWSGSAPDDEDTESLLDLVTELVSEHPQVNP